MEAELVATLQGTLEPNGAVVQEAERHLVQDLHARLEAGLALVHIVLTDPAMSGLTIGIRQAAAVNLGKWITERWAAFFDQFVGFPASSHDANGASGSQRAPSMALPHEYKPAIREALMSSMTLRESKLRGPMIKALINVASCDWPDEFPDLLPRVKQLLQASQSGSEDHAQTEGALAFLDEWSYSSMDESSIVSVTRDLFPDLERLVSDPAQSMQVRCHCIRILSQTLDTLSLAKVQFPDVAKVVASDLLPKWINILLAIIETDPRTIVGQSAFDRRAGEHLALQEQAWITLIVVTAYTAQISIHVPKILSIAISTLKSLKPAFELHHIRPDNEIDPPDDVRFFATPQGLASSVIEYFVEVSMKKMFQKSIDASFLLAFVPLLVAYANITASDEEEWLADSSQFVAAGDEDEEGALNDSLRARCTDVLTEFTTSKSHGLFEALQHALTLARVEGKGRRTVGDATWWKEEEAALYLLGGQASEVIEQIEEAREQGTREPLNLSDIIANNILPYMSAEAPPFLHGRCFVFASQYASILPHDLAMPFLDRAVFTLQDNAKNDEEGSDIVKLSSVRCIKNFHHHLPEDLTGRYAGTILSNIAPLLQQDSEDLLVLVIETLLAVTGQSDDSHSDAIPAHVYGEVATACIEAWARQPNYFVVQNTVDDLLDSFAGLKDHAKADATLQSCIPVLADLLTRNEDQLEDPMTPAVIGGALHFAESLARNASSELLQRAHLINALFGPIFSITDRTDDRAIHHSAADLLTILFDKLSSDYAAWKDEQGQSAVQHTLVLVSKMIAPDDINESGGLAPGKLLTTILRKQPQCVEAHLGDIVNAFVARLASAKMPLLAQSLIVPLAYLIPDHVDVIVKMLLDLPVSLPDGTMQPGIVVLLAKWLEFASSFQGFWQTRVSSLGLCMLFTARQRVPALAAAIDPVLVDGDLIPDDNNIIKTRSRSKNMPDRFTQVPIPAKIVKVLTGEYKEAIDGPPQEAQSSAGKTSLGLSALNEEVADVDEDDGEWDDDADDDGEDVGGRFVGNSLFDDFADYRELERVDEEKSYGDDAVWNMPYRSYLKDFFRQAAQDPAAGTLIEPHLNPKEVALVRNALS